MADKVWDALNPAQEPKCAADRSYKGLRSLENLERYAIKTINGNKQFICKYSNDCKLKWMSDQTIAKHKLSI